MHSSRSSSTGCVTAANYPFIFFPLYLCPPFTFFSLLHSTPHCSPHTYMSHPYFLSHLYSTLVYFLLHYTHHPASFLITSPFLTLSYSLNHHVISISFPPPISQPSLYKFLHVSTLTPCLHSLHSTPLHSTPSHSTQENLESSPS